MPKYSKLKTKRELHFLITSFIKNSNKDDLLGLLEYEKQTDSQNLERLLQQKIQTPQGKIMPILHYCFNESKNMVSLFKGKEIADLLIKYGANPEQEDQEGRDFNKLLHVEYYPSIAETITSVIRNNYPDLKKTSQLLSDFPKFFDPDSLKSALNSSIAIVNKSGGYEMVPLIFHCFKINEDNGLKEIIIRKLLTDSLIKLGADPKKNYLGYGSFEDLRTKEYFQLMSDSIITNLGSGNLDSAMTVIEYLHEFDPDSLSEVLNKDHAFQKNGIKLEMPIMQYCIYTARHNLEEFMAVKKFSNQLIKEGHFDPDKKNNLGKNFQETFDGILNGLRDAMVQSASLKSFPLPSVLRVKRTFKQGSYSMPKPPPSVQRSPSRLGVSNESTATKEFQDPQRPPSPAATKPVTEKLTPTLDPTQHH